MCKCVVVSAIFALLGIAVLAIGLILGFAVFDVLIDDYIRESVRLENGTAQYDRWKEPEHPISFRVYFFNVTNADLVVYGDTPLVEEVGPYVYRQYRNRTVENFSEDNDTLTYIRFEHFEFDSDASLNLNEADTITVLNVPLQVTLQMFEMIYNTTAFEEYWRDVFNIEDDDENPLFHTISVNDYLFNGYEFCTNETIQPFCDDLWQILEQSPMFKQTENGIAFSFFDFRNQSDEYFGIHAGINEIHDLGRIVSWNNEDVMNIWDDPESSCNELRGTDATIFPPFNDQASTFDVFYSDICRIFNLQYDGEIEFKEVIGNRYALTAEALSSSAPDHWCHCINATKNLDGENTCLPNGFEDMFNCLGAHFVLSLPHLLWADNSYAQTVEGLNASVTLHQSHADLEAQLGAPLTSAKRLQFNMFLRNNTNITSYIQPSVIPILWFEEVLEISQDLVDYTVNSFLNWTLALEIITWVLVGVGAAILVISIIGCLCFRK